MSCCVQGGRKHWHAQHCLHFLYQDMSKASVHTVILCVVRTVPRPCVCTSGSGRPWALASEPGASVNVASQSGVTTQFGATTLQRQRFGVTTYNAASPPNAASAIRCHHLMWRQQFGVTTQCGFTIRRHHPMRRQETIRRHHPIRRQTTWRDNSASLCVT